MNAVIVNCEDCTEEVKPLTSEEVAERAVVAQEAAARLAQEETRAANEETLRTRLQQAQASCKTYEALASPTNAQTVAHVKLLSRAARGLIRLELRELDAAD